MIDRFNKEYAFLSNFYPSYIDFGGLTYPSSENAYQALKCANEYERIKFTLIDAPSSKKLGRKIKMREGWNDMRVEMMERVLRIKFYPGTDLANMLLSTGEVPLIEGNTWNDTFWGVCRGKGENNLGKLLMAIRQDLRQ